MRKKIITVCVWKLTNSHSSLPKESVEELVGEMEAAGFACYETDIGGEGALYADDADHDEGATTQGATLYLKLNRIPLTLSKYEFPCRILHKF